MSIFPAAMAVPVIAHLDHVGFRPPEPPGGCAALLRCLALVVGVLLSFAGPWSAAAEAQTTGGSAGETFAPGASTRGATTPTAGDAVPGPRGTVTRDPVEEGTEVTFFSIYSTSPVAVEWTYTVSETGDMLAEGEEGTKTVTMPAGVFEFELPPVPTVDDAVHEPDSVVTLRIIGANPPHEIGIGAVSRTVLDNDMPTVSIDDAASVVEGETLSFPVTLDSASYQDVSLDYELAGTARITDDYTPAGDGTLTIPAGETRADIELQTIVDRLAEVDEDVVVTISNIRPPRAALPGTTTATGWIIDNDGQPAVTVGDATAAEDASLVFEVTLSPASSDEVSVQYTVTEGTATENVDYRGRLSGELTFTPGETAQRVELELVEDAVDEPDETVTLELTDVRGATVAGGVATGTIIDNDDPPMLGVADATGPEDASLVFAVTLSDPSSRDIEFRYEVTEGTATEPEDYTVEGGGTLTIPAGDTRADIHVSVVDDDLYDPDETLQVAISDPLPAGSAMIGRAVATGTITDTDGTPTVSVANARAAESARLVFEVTLSPASSREVSLRYEVTEGTATENVDYRGALSGELTFAPGETSKRVELELVDDAVDEPDETVTLALADVLGATLAAGVATGTIADNDDPPVLGVANATGPEGASLVFAVTLTHPSSRDIEFRYEVTEGTATEPEDYTVEGGGTLTIPAGATRADIRVSAVDDAFYEPDEEFEVAISDPLPAGSAMIGRAVATGTITDDDGVPTVTVADATAAEGARLVFEVILSPASSQEVSLRYTVTEGTATENVDYRGQLSGELTFAPGETSKEVALELVDDEIAEDDETVMLALSGVHGGTLAEGVATGTIADDDRAPAVSVADATAAEGEGRLVFAVTLSPVSSREVTVDYEFAPGTATENADYGGRLSGTVTFAPGEAAKEVALELVDDEIAEDDETVMLALSGIRGGTLAEGVATGTIADDDGTPAVTVTDATAAEGEGRLVFAVTLSPASSREVIVEYEFAPGTATENVDYAGPTSGTVTFAPGETSKGVVLDVVDDEVTEEDETVTLALSAPRGSATLAEAAATGTILDDDLPRVTVAAEAEEVAEGGDAVFVLTRAGATTEALTVSFAVTGGDSVLASPPPTGATFEAGAASARVTLATEDDSAFEADATVTLTLAGGSAYEPDGPSRASVVVRDDDDPLEASVGDAAAVPEGGTLTFPVRLSRPVGAAVTVDYMLAGTATAGEDYEGPAAGSVTFAPGETEKTIIVVTVDDEVDESDETVEVTLAAGDSHDLGASRATGVILDDDDPPSVTISAAAGRIVEGEAARFVLRRTGDASESLTVELEVSERGGDMVPAGSEGSRRATFAAGAATATLAVATGSDGVAGPDSEVTATLSGGDGYAVGHPDSATVAVSDGGGKSLLAEGRRLGSASLLRRHVQRFSQLTSVAALTVLDGGRAPSTANLKADGDGAAASGDFGLDLPSGWDGWGSVRYSKLTESADGGVQDFYAGGSRVGADGRSVYGALVGYESAPVTSRGVRLEASHAQFGLYGARRFGEALTLDGAVGWGRGDHDLSLVGGPYPVEATHRSTRLVARGDLTGDFGWGGRGVRIEPQLGLLYAEEDLAPFTDSLGGTAPGERLWLARLGFGPRLTWRRGDGATRASLRVNFDAHNLGPSGEDRDEVSAALELGHRRRLGARGGLDLSAGIDGLGSDWYSSTSFGLTYEGAF